MERQYVGDHIYGVAALSNNVSIHCRGRILIYLLLWDGLCWWTVHDDNRQQNIIQRGWVHTEFWMAAGYRAPVHRGTVHCHTQYIQQEIRLITPKTRIHWHFPLWMDGEGGETRNSIKYTRIRRREGRLTAGRSTARFDILWRIDGTISSGVYCPAKFFGDTRCRSFFFTSRPRTSPLQSLHCHSQYRRYPDKVDKPILHLVWGNPEIWFPY